MKKTLVLLFAALLVVAFTVPASAFDSQFGGLWRTRAFVQTAFSGDDTKSQDVSRVDTRTRLFYTAVFSDNFRFVNQFEFNTVWGDLNGGDIGTDGLTFTVKRSFADMRLGSTRWTVGLQGQVVARGFLFDDDFAGFVARYQPGTTADLLVPVMFARTEDGIQNGRDNNANVDLWGIYPFFPVGNMVINPYLLYQHQNYSELSGQASNDLYWLGVDLDFKFSGWNLWLSGIYQTGEVEGAGSDNNGNAYQAAAGKADVGAFLLGLGFNIPFGGFGIHGEGFYASGDKDPLDDKHEAFFGAEGNSYYWSEIMGLGIFDNQSPINTPGNNLSNIYALDIGIDWNPSDMWKLKADLWYASLVEETAASFGEKALGTELDVVLTYKLIENMNLDLVGAYLFAGDAVKAPTDGKDPYELGLRLQFTF